MLRRHERECIACAMLACVIVQQNAHDLACTCICNSLLLFTSKSRLLTRCTTDKGMCLYFSVMRTSCSYSSMSLHYDILQRYHFFCPITLACLMYAKVSQCVSQHMLVSSTLQWTCRYIHTEKLLCLLTVGSTE
jgi:hypothetical protein